jgi:hypothetical protein
MVSVHGQDIGHIIRFIVWIISPSIHDLHSGRQIGHAKKLATWLVIHSHMDNTNKLTPSSSSPIHIRTAASVARFVAGLYIHTRFNDSKNVGEAKEGRHRKERPQLRRGERTRWTSRSMLVGYHVIYCCRPFAKA